MCSSYFFKLYCKMVDLFRIKCVQKYYSSASGKMSVKVTRQVLALAPWMKQQEIRSILYKVAQHKEPS